MNSKFETLEELDFLGNNHDLKICWIIIFTWQSWQVFWLWTSNRWVLYCVSWLAFCNLPFPFLLLSVISFGICDNHAQQNKKVLQEQLYLKICCHYKNIMQFVAYRDGIPWIQLLQLKLWLLPCKHLAIQKIQKSFLKGYYSIINLLKLGK